MPVFKTPHNWCMYSNRSNKIIFCCACIRCWMEDGDFNGSVPWLLISFQRSWWVSYGGLLYHILF